MKTKVLVFLILLLFLPTVSANVLQRKCEGNYALVKVNESGLVEWRVGFFCPFGCSHGYCLSEATIPVLNVQTKYLVKPGQINIITFKLTNLGTRGDIKLETLEKVPWIKLPEKVTLEKNETKVLFALVDPPSNFSAYNFTIVAIGSTKSYAPSVLVAKKGKLPITSTFRSVSPTIATSILIIFVALGLILKYSPKPQEEEAFLLK